MDINYFIKKQNLLIGKTSTDFIRNEYLAYLQESEKVIGLIGSRGVGKTTLLLQYLKASSQKYIYIYADDIVFQDIRLYELLEEAYSLGRKIVVIDEVLFNNYVKEFDKEIDIGTIRETFSKLLR